MIAPGEAKTPSSLIETVNDTGFLGLATPASRSVVELDENSVCILTSLHRQKIGGQVGQAEEEGGQRWSV